MREITMRWKHFNNNPFGQVNSDCAIRGVAQLLNISWEEAFDKLCKMGRKSKSSPIQGSTIEAVLIEEGYEYIAVHGLPKVKNFMNLEMDLILIDCENHVMCAKHNTVYDTYDSTDLKMLGYFRWKEVLQ